MIVFFAEKLTEIVAWLLVLRKKWIGDVVEDITSREIVQMQAHTNITNREIVQMQAHTNITNREIVQAHAESLQKAPIFPPNNSYT